MNWEEFWKEADREVGIAAGQMCCWNNENRAHEWQMVVEKTNMAYKASLVCFYCGRMRN